MKKTRLVWKRTLFSFLLILLMDMAYAKTNDVVYGGILVLGNSTLSYSFWNESYLTSAIANGTYVKKTGDTMTGNLTVLTDTNITGKTYFENNTVYRNGAELRFGNALNIRTTATSPLGQFNLYTNGFNLQSTGISEITVGGGGLDIGGSVVFNDGVTFVGIIQSGVVTGTAPFIISSTTLNTNLNADLLDSLHASSFCLGNGTGCNETLLTTETDPLSIKNDTNANLTNLQISNALKFSTGSERIWNPYDDFIWFSGIGGTSDVVVEFDLDGTNPDIYSSTTQYLRVTDKLIVQTAANMTSSINFFDALATLTQLGSGTFNGLSFDPYVNIPNQAQTGSITAVFSRLRMGLGNYSTIDSLYGEVQFQDASIIPSATASPLHLRINPTQGKNGSIAGLRGINFDIFDTHGFNVTAAYGIYLPSVINDTGLLTNVYQIYLEPQGLGGNAYGIFSEGAKSGAIVLDADDRNGSIIWGETQDIKAFWNDTNGSLEFTNNVKFDNNVFIGGVLTGGSPIVLCGEGEDSCFGVDFKTKTSTFCSMSAGTCDTKNPAIEQKLAKVKSFNALKQTYEDAHKICDDATHTYSNWEQYQNGKRECKTDDVKVASIKNKERLNCETDNFHRYDGEKCIYYEKEECESITWQYWDGSCRINPFYECTESPEFSNIYTWDGKSCVYDEVKANKYACGTDGTSEWVNGQCVENAELKCRKDRSKIWDGSKCVNANGIVAPKGEL